MDFSEFSNDKLSRKDFEFLGLIKATSYGKIEKARSLKDNKEYALKIFEKIHIPNPDELRNLSKEKAILSNLKNPQPFLAIHSTFTDTENIYFVLDYCQNGTLHQFMQRFASFPFELARFYAGELVIILENLRAESLVHSRINPHNLVITSDFHLHLTNFENAYRTNENITRRISQEEHPEYFSPETLEGETAPSGDIWAAGCVIYQMLAGKGPFHSSAPYLIYDKIRNGQVDFPGIIPPFAVDLIQNMLLSDPTIRLGANDLNDLKSHIFFQGLEVSQIYSMVVPNYKQDMSKDEHSSAKIIMEGVVKKKAGWIFKRRLLVISEEPKITYYEPSRKEFRGEIAISQHLRGEVKNKIDFHIITPKRTYYFKVINDTPEKWVKAVAELVKKVYG